MKRTITVSGSGRVTVVPDIADVRLGVTVIRPTVAEARAAAADIATHLLAAVTAAGVARADIRTAGLQVQPEYEYSDGAPRLTGQSVSHQYVVTVRALDLLGRVIDDALAAGATTLDSVAFRTADPARAEAAARVAAVGDARSRAEALATEAGAQLGEVLSIVEREGGLGLRGQYGGDEMLYVTKAAPTPVEAGTAEIVVGIVATFAIAPAGT